MSSHQQNWKITETPFLGAAATESDAAAWFAVHTRARHEKVLAQRLREKGVTAFLPLVKSVHRWSDRKKTVELPVFSSYLFVNLAPTHENRLRVLMEDGILGFVGIRRQGIAIPDEQIDTIRMLVEQQLPYSSHPFLKIGQRVRVRNGALSGMEGILVSRSGENTLVISVDALQRSLGVRIEGYDVEPI